jgi:hypothetical protein
MFPVITVHGSIRTQGEPGAGALLHHTWFHWLHGSQGEEDGNPDDGCVKPLGVHGEHGVGVLLHGSHWLHGSQSEEDGNSDGCRMHLLGVHGEHGVGVLVHGSTGYMVPRVRNTGTLMVAVCTSLESMANTVLVYWYMGSRVTWFPLVTWFPG